jgi:YidC/Oxa1 family membrane protein insertase
MDKKTILGLVLICLVFVVFGIMNKPTEEQKAMIKHQQDSILAAQKKQKQNANKVNNNQDTVTAQADDILALSKKAQGNDSLESQLKDKITKEYSVFSSSVIDTIRHINIENDVFNVDLQNRGGEVSQVTLKKYKTYYKKPVTFFTKDGNHYGLNLSVGQIVVKTEDLFFKVFVNNRLYLSNKPIKVSGKDSIVVSMRLIPNNPMEKMIILTFKVQNNI